MTVSDAVQLLADAVLAAEASPTPRQRLLIEILRLLPIYRDADELCAWESAFQEAIGPVDDDSSTVQNIWETFEFGRHNMYGAFDPETLEVFNFTAAGLRQRGVNVDDLGEPIADW